VLDRGLPSRADARLVRRNGKSAIRLPPSTAPPDPPNLIG
jgi:hypothetical protein